MRKNSPRKWLHACLDLLPVLLIPVFMIYSHRHTLTEQAQSVPLYQTNDVNTIDDLIEGNIYYTDELLISAGSGNNDYSIRILKSSQWSPSTAVGTLELGEIYLEDYDSSYGNFLEINTSGDYVSFYFTNVNGYVEEDGSNGDYDETFYNCYFIVSYNIENFKTYYNQLAFSDNPITRSDWNVYEIEQGSPNIMNVFMDSFNSSIDRYFNMGNVFNLSGVYDWFNTNIFNGNCPQVIYSVWNIALYELVMDLLFLLYGLFMWFIDMVEHLMDKPFKSIK